ncbi:DNA circularization protein [Pantoea sp. BAV 3049]|uniref:DNA circularization protein n=1 Tax=Pantoea sp. BAV 3049 TaxID=2654188 RepID=UPI00131A9B84|nr:DNA circularization N-terminal domain-containing protein [Pantoea sp. BAV 3049]
MSDFISQLAALAGVDTLLQASFRGVEFECLATRDTLARDTVSYAYPYHDGATVEDQGLKPVNFRITAFLFGSDWKQQLKALITTFKTGGPGELIHPVYGSIPRAQFLEAGIDKQAETMDGVTIELVFIESGEEQALFSAASAAQASESISSTGSSLLDSAASAFSTAMSDIRTLENGAERINTIVAQGEYVLDSVREQIQGAAASVSNLLDTPTALVSDLKSLFSTFSDSLTLTGTGVKSDWQQVTRLADNAVSYPAAYIASRSITTIKKAFALPLSQVTAVRASDTALVNRTVRLVAVSELSEVASTVMENETTTPSLTGTQIEAITNNVRGVIVDALADERSAMQETVTTARQSGLTADTRTHSAIISTLQQLAYALQVQAYNLIQQRPPLITREVTRRANLHLIAFDWYADASRAEELLRLNPSLSNPNDLQPGVTLYAYAK